MEPRDEELRAKTVARSFQPRRWGSARSFGCMPVAARLQPAAQTLMMICFCSQPTAAMIRRRVDSSDNSRSGSTARRLDSEGGISGVRDGSGLCELRSSGPLESSAPSSGELPRPSISRESGRVVGLCERYGRRWERLRDCRRTAKCTQRSWVPRP